MDDESKSGGFRRLSEERMGVKTTNQKRARVRASDGRIRARTTNQKG